MSGFFQDQLKNAAGAFFGSDYVRDYTHASKTFRPNSYQYAPKFKFLFHVYFDINPSAYAVGLNTGANFGLLVKTIKLPSFNFDTAVMNQYNRKRIVQTKIKYEPIDITFHDDNGNLVRDMWYNYFSYYYSDPTKPMLVQSSNQSASSSSTYTGAADYNQRNIYNNDITGDVDWGYIGETGNSPQTQTQIAQGASKVPFFKNIMIYGFNQHKAVQYVLVNPVITRFTHDTYDYSQGNGTMECSMTIDYETVKYFDGAMDGDVPSNAVPGFGNPSNYDTTLSPIAMPGSQRTILGQGGLVDAAGGFMNDLQNGNILGAVQKAGAAYNTFKNVNIKQVATSEILTDVTNAVQNTPNRNVNFQFPSFGSTPSNKGTAGATSSGISSPPVINNNNN